MAEPSPTAQTLYVNFLQITQLSQILWLKSFLSELESGELDSICRFNCLELTYLVNVSSPHNIYAQGVIWIE